MKSKLFREYFSSRLLFLSIFELNISRSTASNEIPLAGNMQEILIYKVSYFANNSAPYSYNVKLKLTDYIIVYNNV